MDDGSGDDTLNIVRRYESSVLKVNHQKNGGACRARNCAPRECQGDYIQWLDADDLLAPDKIERQMAVADDESDPDVLLSSEWGKFSYRLSKSQFQPTPLWQDLSAVDWLVSRLANTWNMIVPAWLVSRKLTEKTGPWDESLHRTSRATCRWFASDRGSECLR